MMLFFSGMSSPEYIEKYNKYQADYIRRLKAKYFSKRSFNGGKWNNILHW